MKSQSIIYDTQNSLKTLGTIYIYAPFQYLQQWKWFLKRYKFLIAFYEDVDKDDEDSDDDMMSKISWKINDLFGQMMFMSDFDKTIKMAGTIIIRDLRNWVHDAACDASNW